MASIVAALAGTYLEVETSTNGYNYHRTFNQTQIENRMEHAQTAPLISGCAYSIRKECCELETEFSEEATSIAGFVIIVKHNSLLHASVFWVYLTSGDCDRSWPTAVASNLGKGRDLGNCCELLSSTGTLAINVVGHSACFVTDQLSNKGTGHIRPYQLSDCGFANAVENVALSEPEGLLESAKRFAMQVRTIPVLILRGGWHKESVLGVVYEALHQLCECRVNRHFTNPRYGLAVHNVEARHLLHYDNVFCAELAELLDSSTCGWRA